jgi:hypothetical protein
LAGSLSFLIKATALQKQGPSAELLAEEGRVWSPPCQAADPILPQLTFYPDQQDVFERRNNHPLDVRRPTIKAWRFSGI